MINFRFHVVSLIAIFLALALGVVIGAGVIDRGVVDTLNSRLDRVESKSERIQSENDALSSENSQLSGVISDLQSFAVAGRLVGDTVGFVALRGINEDRVKAAVTATQSTGGKVSGVVWLEDKWALSGDADVKALQSALGVTIKNKNALRTEAWRQLGLRFGTAPADVSSPDDLVAKLVDDGFLSLDTLGVSGATVTDFPGRDAAIVFVSGTNSKVPATDLVVPAATGIRNASVPLVLVDEWVEVTNGPSRAASLQPVRDGALARTVSTVDDLDLPQGPTTVVLALADIVQVPPIVGHYGYGPGTQPLPDPASA